MEDGDRVVGYGWLDDVWGDAEILLAVEERARGTGAGAFALARLEEEAAARGLNYVVNVVRDTHPDRDARHRLVPGPRVHAAPTTAGCASRSATGADIGQRQAGARDRPGRAAGRGRRARYDAERERAAARPRDGDARRAADLGPGRGGERRLRRPGAPPLLTPGRVTG